MQATPVRGSVMLELKVDHISLAGVGGAPWLTTNGQSFYISIEPQDLLTLDPKQLCSRYFEPIVSAVQNIAKQMQNV